MIFNKNINIKYKGFPSDLVALDVYIGDLSYCYKGLGATIINKFVTNYVFLNFNSCFVDPDKTNYIAIKAFKKAGFSDINLCISDQFNFMIKNKFLHNII